VHDHGRAHLRDDRRWRLDLSGHAASWGAARTRAEEGADAGAAMDGCGGGEVCVGGGISPCGGGDAAR
jgi:hypothetical protein